MTTYSSFRYTRAEKKHAQCRKNFVCDRLCMPIRRASASARPAAAAGSGTAPPPRRRGSTTASPTRASTPAARATRRGSRSPLLSRRRRPAPPLLLRPRPAPPLPAESPFRKAPLRERPEEILVRCTLRLSKHGWERNTTKGADGRKHHTTDGTFVFFALKTMQFFFPDCCIL